MRSCAVLVSASLLLGIPAAGAAQSLRYTSVTQAELGGALGSMMSMLGAGKPSESTTSIQGSKIRTDSDNSSTIIDWATGKIILLDNKAHTYASTDFATMTKQMTEAMQGAHASSDSLTSEGATAQPGAAEQPEIEWDVRFNADRTGEKQQIDGYEADRMILTTEVLAKNVPQGDEKQEQAGIAIVSELWLSKDFPEYEMMRKMQGEAVEQMREQASQGMASSMKALSGAQPGLSDAWKKNEEELAKLDGYAVRSTMLFVAIPPGVELDRDAALARKDAKLSSSVARAAGQSTEDAAKKALQGLAGRFGRKKAEEPKTEEPAMTQALFMRVKSEVQNVETTAIDPSVFEIPEGYTERPMGAPGGR